MQRIRNSRGQGLIEYLIITALIAVACIGIMRVLGNTVNVQFANITKGLQGESGKVKTEKVEERHYKKRDLSDFISGAANRE
jgi:Flp pilus assembly pilin Flp